VSRVVLAALIIVFREVFEAGLIIGIGVRVTRSVPIAINGSRRLLAGVLAACVSRCSRRIVNLFAGAGQEVFNAAILCVAVVMLTWHNVWMARHGSELAGELRAAAGGVEGSKSLLALAVVVGVACCARAANVLFCTASLRRGDTGGRCASAALLVWAMGAMVCLLTYFGCCGFRCARCSPHNNIDRAVGRGHGRAGDAFSGTGQLGDSQDTVVWTQRCCRCSIIGRALHT